MHLAGSGVVRLMGQASKEGLGRGGLLHNLSGMYYVCDTGLSENFTLLAGASEMRLTVVSLFKLWSRPERTKFCTCSSRFPLSLAEMTEFSLKTASSDGTRSHILKYEESPDCVA